MNIHNYIKKFTILITIMVYSSTYAGTNSGTITSYHLNKDVASRGACITMTPALSTGWACLWKDNMLYAEFNALILGAHMLGRNCEIIWGSIEPTNGYAIISMATCN